MRQGMTLVELLIVVAIIAVMAGLSMSVLMRVRQRAYLATCISNLRQLVQAVHMYEDDWGTVPIEERVKTLEGSYGFVMQLLYPYVNNNDTVFLCPADFTGGRFHYAEDALGNPKPYNPKIIVWKGREWLTSYDYFVDNVAFKVFGRGDPRLKPNSPLFSCLWHIPNLRVEVLARYNGVVEVTPAGFYKDLHALFEGAEEDN